MLKRILNIIGFILIASPFVLVLASLALKEGIAASIAVVAIVLLLLGLFSLGFYLMEL